MFALSSAIVTIVLVLIGWFIFNSTIKQAAKQAPEIVSDGLTMLAVGTKYARDCVFVNEAEARMELQTRARQIQDAINANGNTVINLEQLAATIRNGQ